MQMYSTGAEEWRAVTTPESRLYDWSEESTYIQSPPFFADLTPQPRPVQPISGARTLVMVGDSITTDHISRPVPSLRRPPPGVI